MSFFPESKKRKPEEEEAGASAAGGSSSSGRCPRDDQLVWDLIFRGSTMGDALSYAKMRREKMAQEAEINSLKAEISNLKGENLGGSSSAGGGSSSAAGGSSSKNPDQPSSTLREQYTIQEWQRIAQLKYDFQHAQTALLKKDEQMAEMKAKNQKQIENIENQVAYLIAENERVQAQRLACLELLREEKVKSALLEAENTKLKGENLELPPDELGQLLEIVTRSFRKISDTKHLEKVMQNLDDRLRCRKSKKPLLNPVIAPDGEVYDETFIGEWIMNQLEAHKHDDDLSGLWESPTQSGRWVSDTALRPFKTMKAVTSDQIEKDLIAERVKQVSR